MRLIPLIKKNLSPIKCVGNIFVWHLIKRIKPPQNPSNPTILYIPCDPKTIWGSRGDEAMILSSMRILEQKYKNKKFCFITSSQEGAIETKKRGYNAILAWKGIFPIYHIAKAIRQIRPSRVIIIGADCMDGYYSFFVSFMLMASAELCYKYGIPYHILGFSFNKKPSWWLKTIYFLCSSPIKFNLRDIYSQERFKKFTHKNSTLVADMAFLLKANTNFTDYAYFHSWYQSQKQNIIVGFNFHPMLKKKQKKEDIYKSCISLAQMIIQLLEKHRNLSFFFIPHDNRGKISDNIVLPIIANEIREKGYAHRIMEVTKIYHADQIKALANLCDIMICSRMHLAIGSLSSNVPVMAATYQDKFQGLFKHYNLPHELLLTPEDFITISFINTFEKLLATKEQLVTTLKEQQLSINQLSAKNLE